MPAISQRANFANLRKIVDTTNQMIRALPTLEVSVDTWDPFIELIISRKLDEYTRHEWKKKKGPHAKPSAQDTLEWLEVQAFELQPTPNDRPHKMHQGENRKHHQRKVFQINEKKSQPPKESEKTKKCLICGGPHKIRDCTKFQNECAKARTEIVKSLKLCFKCLLKHQLGICDQQDCNYCGGPHNVMLCYKRETDRNHRNPQPQDDSDWDKEKPSTSKNYRN